jgi:hypothetical protein
MAGSSQLTAKDGGAAWPRPGQRWPPLQTTWPHVASVAGLARLASGTSGIGQTPAAARRLTGSVEAAAAN